MPLVKIGDGFSSWSNDYYDGAASVTLLSSDVEQNKSRVKVELKYGCNGTNTAQGIELAQLGVGEVEFVIDGVLHESVLVQNRVESGKRIVYISFEVDVPHSNIGFLEAFHIDVRGKLIYDTENNYSYFINEAGTERGILVDTSNVEMLPLYSINIQLKDGHQNNSNTIAASVSINGEFAGNNTLSNGSFFHSLSASKALKYTDTVSVALTCTPPERVWNVLSNLGSLNVHAVDMESYTIEFVVGDAIDSSSVTGHNISINVSSKVCLSQVSSATYSNCALDLNIEIPTGRYGYVLSFTCGDTTFPDTVPKRTDSNVNIALSSKHFAALAEANDNIIRINCHTVMDNIGEMSASIPFDVPVEMEAASVTTDSDSYNLGSEAALSYSDMYDIFDYSIWVMYGSIHDNLLEKWINSSGYLSGYEEFLKHNTMPHSLELTDAYAMAIPNSASGALLIRINTYAKKDDGTRVLLGVRDTSVNYTVPDTTRFKPAIMDLYYIDERGISNYLASGSKDSLVRNTKVTKGASKCYACVSILSKAYSTISSVKIGGRAVDVDGADGVYSGRIEIDLYNTPENLTVEITDSRNLKTTNNISLDINDLPYNPIILEKDSIDIKRVCLNKDPTASIQEFTHVKVTATLDISSFNFGTENNRWYVYYTYEVNDSGASERKVLTEALTPDSKDIAEGGKVTFSRILDEEFDTSDDVKISLYVYDTHGEYISSCITGVTYDNCLSSDQEISIVVKSFKPVFDFGEDSFNLNVDLLIRNENIFSLIYPVGAIYTTARDNVPECFNGTWTNIGSTLQGSVTVKYFQRTE